jgi:hypothetical protein
MATKKFDSLFENLLNELSPVTADYETWSGGIEKSIETAAGGGYGIGKLADALGIKKADAFRLISKSIYDKVFPGGTNKANNNTAFRNSIQDAVFEVINNVAKDKNVKLDKFYKPIAGYTARIIDQLGKTEKVYGSSATPQEVEQAVEDASEESVENGAPTEPKAPKAARYMDEAEYEILTPEEMSEAGIKLSDELMTYYSRIENLADQVQKGKDIASAVSGGEDIARGSQKVSALIRAGAIKYASAENSDQDIEALEAGEEDIEDIGRREFEKSFGKAYKDYMSSQPGAMNVGFED